MKILWSVLLIMLITSSVWGAEIRDGRLYLELYLTGGNTIAITPQSSFTISEVNSPVAVDFRNGVTLQLVNGEQSVMYGLINQTEIIKPEDYPDYLDENVREKFVWQDGRLCIQYEKLTFEDKYFTTVAEAEKYASETGYNKKLIRTIPMQNARLKVSESSGDVHYFQLPVRVSATDDIRFGSNPEEYTGCFIVKPHQGSLMMTHLQDIENYVAGVVPNEIGDNAPYDALCAQAVSARTHAISLMLYNRHSDDGYDLCNGTHCQVYRGNYLRGEAIDKSVLDTKGIVMLYAGKIADGVYCSNCGGKTESNQYAWSGKAIPYLQGVACNADTDSLNLSHENEAVEWINTRSATQDMASWERRAESWERSIDRSKLAGNAGVIGLHSLIVKKRGTSGRIISLELQGSNTVTVEGEYKIRQLFGGLPSSFFYVSNSKNVGSNIYALPQSITIKGKGFGHGVGMCQVGTLQKARAGWNWQDIIQLYYPQVELSSDWLNLLSMDHQTSISD